MRNLGERWLVKVMVTQAPGDQPPTEWDWGEDAVVIDAMKVGLVAPGEDD